METVHVKNTGRGTRVLIPGAKVYLAEPGTPGRKTCFDFVAAQKVNGMLINIDSQAPYKDKALSVEGKKSYVQILRLGNSKYKR